jgi:DNA mismatch repair protein MutL
LSSAEPILALDDAVVAGIAAGEVVERPASIVKELIENSLDAGASRITLAYDDEGLAVTDDGRGIEAAQLRLAVARHATSKIRTLGDLERIATFGFRGEALASVAGVSRLEVLSRTRDAAVGCRIVSAHGRCGELEEAAARPGTRVCVRELFAGVPARRKFLKSEASEYGLASDVVRRFALARPDVHFGLERGGKTVFQHAPVGELSARIRQVYGPEIAGSMLPVDARYRGLRLRGALSAAGASWGSARRMVLWVNGRWVHDRLLFRAVMDGYRTYLLRGRYPAAALFLDIDPRSVDVNVHPQKLEVRFSEPDVLLAFVAEAVSTALRAGSGTLGRWGLAAGPRAEARATSHASRFAPPPRPRALASQDAATPEPAEELPGYVEASAEAIAATGSRAVAEQPALFASQSRSVDGLEVIGQVFAGYILCQRGEELLLIDQHAAHERVLYERLVTAFAENRLERQPLMLPQVVHVGIEGVEAVAKHADRLAELGWDLDAFGEEEIAVRSLPALASGANVEALAERLVADLVRGQVDTAASGIVERMLATVACHAAIRVGKKLDRQGARALLDEIASVDFAAACPHGRPVARSIDRGRIERMFGR